MSSVVLLCTVCGQGNILPYAHTNMQKREGMMTFCNTCGAVTLQRVSGPSNPGQEPMTSMSQTPISMAPTMSGDPSRRTPAFDMESDDSLWRSLQVALANNGITLADLFRCDNPTKQKLLSTLGFHEKQCEQLLRLTDERNPRNVMAAAEAQADAQSHTDPEAAHDMASAARGNDGATELEKATARTGATAQTAKTRVASEYATARAPTTSATANATPRKGALVTRPASTVKGLSVGEDGTLTARCSVYPHLAAEFWCSQCGVLVSSRCHVTGIHKDHPFITLRLAAESHIQELSTWAERCRNQLNVAENIVANLHHAEDIIRSAQQHEEEKLDKHVDEMVDELMKWRDELKESIRLQTDAQVKNIGFALTQTDDMIQYYAQHLHACDPLMGNIPPVEQDDQQSADWALRVVDLVSRLKLCSREPIPMPRLTVPEVKCFATPASYMELLKAISVPVGVRIPDIIDPGYLGFPTSTSTSRTPFALQVPPDAKDKGILVYSNRTLTRSQEIIPVHSLVTSTQVFYTGVTAWEVHIDRMGAGPGRILAGILIAGTDGEGVVWDGRRIVGPNEGECRVVDDRFTLKTGTTLRFVLELESPAHFLNCFFEREPVARVPLPPTNHGWTPAFSVFGPQDQITVVPMSTTSPLALKSTPSEDANSNNRTTIRLSEQEQMISALQQQLLAVNARIDQEQYQLMINDAAARAAARNASSETHGPSTYGYAPRSLSTATGKKDDGATYGSGALPFGDGVAGKSSAPFAPTRSTSGAAQPLSASVTTLQGANYSPELRQLLSFMDNIKH